MDLEQNGGALRSYPQQLLAEESTFDSTHLGNLQVGWLLERDQTSQPVYLDSWLPVMGIVSEGTIPEPYCMLYTLEGGDT